jgi:hypothetical protein
MANSNQMKAYNQAVNRFNEEVEEAIKHLIGTTGVIDPYDVEDGVISPEEGRNLLKEKGYQIFSLRDPYHPNRMDCILYQKDDLIAGTTVTLDIKTLDVSRKMAMINDLSDYAKKFINAMKPIH